MIVSWNWLKEYVDLSMSVDELTERLTLSGLNLEGVEKVGDEVAGSDVAIDLEVTSNRPDCLGHIGVAREIAVLWNQPLKKPQAAPASAGPKAAEQTSVTIDCPDLCPRYTARILRGVKIGPSPDWLITRLQSLGIATINNVVDISNFVMMECGQPLHVFDFAKLAGSKIIVRKATPGEKFTAINHQEYELSPNACVIADANRPVALAGVMGGAETEVSDTTTDLLIEAADFAPLSVRNTARRLNLQSPSSYRFERGVDPEGIDWASRRCCELILKLAGGELAEGVVDVAVPTKPREEVKLRFDQLPRILGISVPEDQVRKILTDLGNRETHVCEKCVKVVPPTWRADLTREIDLIEEIARIHGYDKIPEDTGVKMVASKRTREDRVLDRVRDVMVGAGFDEAITLSAVDHAWSKVFGCWSDAEPLTTSTPILRRANCLRQSLLPSLLDARRTNESLSNTRIELFEIADIYLPPSEKKLGKLPDERRMLGITSAGGFLQLKGAIEALLDVVAPGQSIEVAKCDAPLFATGRGCEISVGQRTLGYLGEVSVRGLEQFGLREGASVAELDLGVLVDLAVMIRRVEPISPYPPMTRDLNVVLDEQVCWADVARIVRKTGGKLLEKIAYQETYRDKKRLGEGKKSVLLTLSLRSAEGTLTNEEADALRDRIVAELGSQLGGELRA